MWYVVKKNVQRRHSFQFWLCQSEALWPWAIPFDSWSPFTPWYWLDEEMSTVPSCCKILIYCRVSRLFEGPRASFVEFLNYFITSSQSMILESTVFVTEALNDSVHLLSAHYCFFWQEESGRGQYLLADLKNSWRNQECLAWTTMTTGEIETIVE